MLDDDDDVGGSGNDYDDDGGDGDDDVCGGADDDVAISVSTVINHSECFRHVSSSDKVGKRYRGGSMAPVFTIGDDDEGERTNPKISPPDLRVDWFDL